jgi:hypothetical protein
MERLEISGDLVALTKTSLWRSAAPLSGWSGPSGGKGELSERLVRPIGPSGLAGLVGRRLDIALRRVQRLVAEQRRDLGRAGAVFGEAGGERVPQGWVMAPAGTRLVRPAAR